MQNNVYVKFRKIWWTDIVGVKDKYIMSARQAALVHCCIMSLSYLVYKQIQIHTSMHTNKPRYTNRNTHLLTHTQILCTLHVARRLTLKHHHKQSLPPPVPPQPWFSLSTVKLITILNVFRSKLKLNETQKLSYGTRVLFTFLLLSHV